MRGPTEGSSVNVHDSVIVLYLASIHILTVHSFGFDFEIKASQLCTVASIQVCMLKANVRLYYIPSTNTYF